MVTYTTTDLVTAIKRTAHVPEGNSTFSVTDFLALSDTEMRTGVAPKIASCRENYWLTTQRTPIDNGTNQYSLPSKALGSAIVDVKVDQANVFIHLVRVEISQIYSDQYTTMPSYGYYIQDAVLKIIPPTLNGDLVMWYYRIPSQLVPTTSCGQISAINYSTGDVTVSSLPSSFIGGGELDIVSQQPGFNVLVMDSTPTAIVSNTITFPSVPTTVQVGDWVCLSGQSCVVQAPLEWIEVLVQRVTVKIYEIQGYLSKNQAAKKTLMEMEAATLGLVSPRTVENPKIIMGGGSLLTPQTRAWGLPVRGNA